MLLACPLLEEETDADDGAKSPTGRRSGGRSVVVCEQTLVSGPGLAGYELRSADWEAFVDRRSERAEAFGQLQLPFAR